MVIDCDPSKYAVLSPLLPYTEDFQDKDPVYRQLSRASVHKSLKLLMITIDGQLERASM
jgi:hypothetical protein